jgi:riboflavin kinase/FMN adenylyltransferase
VSELLGRRFTLTGIVESGAGRGGPLGFPTANLAPPPNMAIPGDGIYATWAHIGGSRHMAATSVGRRPTFDDGKHAIEAFVLDFEGDLYGHEIGLEFVRHLRDEARFDTVQELQEQVEKDVAETRAILEGGKVAPGPEVAS